jgi:polar amino acid transport system substrate-binding protein
MKIGGGRAHAARNDTKTGRHLRMVIVSGLAVALCVLALTMWAPPASAGSLDEIRSRGKLVVGVKTDYAPLGFIDASGHNAGVEIELAKFIARQLLGDPAKVEFVPVVFKNRVDYLLSGKIDMILATMVTTPDRLKIVDATIPYLRPGGATLMAPKSGPVTSWETTRGHDICGIEASYFNPTITNRFGAHIIEFADASHAYDALAAGRCAGFAFDEILVRLKVKDPQWSGFAVVGEPLQVNGFQIGVRKNDEAFLAKLNELILRAQADGKMVQWEQQYGMDPDYWSVAQVGKARDELANR